MMEPVSARINEDGSTSLTIEIGGIATEIVAITATRITVRNARGEVYSRTIGVGPWTLDSAPVAPQPTPQPPQEVITVAWEKIGEERQSNGNQFDQYKGPEGRAIAWRAWGDLCGYVNNVWFKVPRPPEGNVQWLQILPETDGWYVYTWNDPGENRRQLWREKVAAR